MSWCPDPSNALMAAVGTRSGQIALTQLRDFDSPGAQQPIGLMGMSGLRRVTSDVAWCPASADLVASAMTGGQAAAAVNVWRIERVAADSSAAHTDLGAGISVGSFATPADRQLGSVGSTPLVASFLKADSASALDWQPGSASCLAVALMSRTVVLVDSRLSHSRFPDFTVHLPSRNIVTVQYEPGDASSLLTSTDCGDVRVWDLRMLDKPRSVIESSRRTTHTGLGFARWCPGQQGLVSTLAADGLTVELWDERRQQIVAAERRAAAAEDASGGGAAAAGAPRGSDRPAAGRDPVHLRGSASAARRLLQSELSGMDMAGAIGPGWSRGAGASRVLVAGRDGAVTDLGMRLVGAVDIFVGSGGAVAARVADTALTVAPTPLRSVAAPIGITARMRRRVAAGVGLNPARTCFALSRAVAALGWQHSVDRVLALASADAASAAGLSHPAHSQGALLSPGGWPGVEAGMPRQVHAFGAAAAAAAAAGTGAGAGGSGARQLAWPSSGSDPESTGSPRHLTMRGEALVSPSISGAGRPGGGLPPRTPAWSPPTLASASLPWGAAPPHAPSDPGWSFGRRPVLDARTMSPAIGSRHSPTAEFPQLLAGTGGRSGPTNALGGPASRAAPGGAMLRRGGLGGASEDPLNNTRPPPLLALPPSVPGMSTAQARLMMACTPPPTSGSAAGGGSAASRSHSVAVSAAVDEDDDDAGLCEDAHGGADAALLLLRGLPSSRPTAAPGTRPPPASLPTAIAPPDSRVSAERQAISLPGQERSAAGRLCPLAQELRRQSKNLRCLRATWEWVAGPEASAAAAKAALRAAGRRLRGAAPGTPLGALPPVPTGLPRLGMISLLAGRSADASPARDASDDAPTAEGGPFRVGPFVAFGGAARAAALASCGWVTADEWSSCRLRPEDEASAVDPAEVWLDAAGKPVPKLGVAGSVPGVVLRCLAEGAYERAAALAVWHGDLRLATAVLRTAAERAEAQLKALQAALLAARAPAEGGAGAGVSAALLQAAADDRGVFKRAVYLAQEHRELMQLTAMAVAGFPGAGAAAEEAIRSGTCLPAAAVDGGSHLWADTCDGLRRRMRSKHPYLRCICAFLAACARPDAASTAQTLSDLQESAFGPAAGQNAAPGAAAAPAARPPVEAEWSTSPFLSILVERGLRRQDRAAFAARFLPDSQLLPFTRALARGAIMDGNILGLVLTGFTNAGVRVIQAYVDRTGDVHTAALLACFFDPSKVSARSARRALRWLQSFRDLLNRWKLWRERATLDVQRAKMVRSMEASKAAVKPSWRDRAAAAQPRPDGGTGPSAPAGSAAGAAAAAPAPAAASEQEQARDLALLGDLEPAGSLPPQVYSTATKASRWQDPSRAMRVTRRALPGGKGRSSALLTSGRAAGPSVRGHAAEAASAPSSLTVAQRLLGAVVTQHPAVFAFCNFCGDALALPWMVRSGKVNGEWVMKQRQRLIFCPMCHNPLPRCSLCLISMVSINPYKQWKLQSPATAQGRAASKPSSGREVADAPAVAPHLAVDEGDRPVPEDSANFSDWWTWCQSCRHGGHASHLAAWFKGHDVCPISGCGCRCRVLDERALASSDGEEDANALLFELD